MERMNNKLIRLLIDSMMLTLFLALLALPFGTIGLFGMKPPAKSNIQVLGDKSEKHYKVLQKEAKETTQSTRTAPVLDVDLQTGN